MNLKPDIKSDPADLEGLDGLLDQAHVELVETNNKKEQLEESGVHDSAAYVDMRMTLELLDQVQQVRDLLSETNTRLTRAYSRVRHLQHVVDEQEKRLELLPAIQKQADRALVLQNKLDEAVQEIEKLRQPWWHKLNNQEEKLDWSDRISVRHSVKAIVILYNLWACYSQ